MEMNIKSVATHWRDFHADDVFAIAILKLLYPKIKVIRAEYRDYKEQQKADMRVDVGGKYDPETLDFDHHQTAGAGVRQNGIPYAACGLIWHHFGLELVQDERIVEEIDKKLIQTIDALDSGIEITEVKIIKAYTISDYIMSLNPQWPDKSMKKFDKNFEYAIEFAIHILKTEINKIRGRLEAENILRDYISRNENKNYLILYDSLPWKEYVVQNTSFKYVIEYDKLTKNWHIQSVPLMVDSFERRHSFPLSWSGLSEEELQRVSGVDGAIFCHRGLFFAVAKTKEDAVKMVNIALNKK
jgi:uncharacterized UPF0160 family protein